MSLHAARRLCAATLSHKQVRQGEQKASGHGKSNSGVALDPPLWSNVLTFAPGGGVARQGVVLTVLE